MPIAGSLVANQTFGEGAGGDIITKIDKVAEETIVNSLKEKQLECTMVSEESGIFEIGKRPKVHLVVDGIDGTTNALLDAGEGHCAAGHCDYASCPTDSAESRARRKNSRTLWRPLLTGRLRTTGTSASTR